MVDQHWRRMETMRCEAVRGAVCLSHVMPCRCCCAAAAMAIASPQCGRRSVAAAVAEVIDVVAGVTRRSASNSESDLELLGPGTAAAATALETQCAAGAVATVTTSRPVEALDLRHDMPVTVVDSGSPAAAALGAAVSPREPESIIVRAAVSAAPVPELSFDNSGDASITAAATALTHHGRASAAGGPEGPPVEGESAVTRPVDHDGTRFSVPSDAHADGTPTVAAAAITVSSLPTVDAIVTVAGTKRPGPLRLPATLSAAIVCGADAGLDSEFDANVAVVEERAASEAAGSVDESSAAAAVALQDSCSSSVSVAPVPIAVDFHSGTPEPPRDLEINAVADAQPAHASSRLYEPLAVSVASGLPDVDARRRRSSGGAGGVFAPAKAATADTGGGNYIRSDSSTLTLTPEAAAGPGTARVTAAAADDDHLEACPVESRGGLARGGGHRVHLPRLDDPRAEAAAVHEAGAGLDGDPVRPFRDTHGGGAAPAVPGSRGFGGSAAALGPAVPPTPAAAADAAFWWAGVLARAHEASQRHTAAVAAAGAPKPWRTVRPATGTATPPASRRGSTQRGGAGVAGIGWIEDVNAAASRNHAVRWKQRAGALLAEIDAGPRRHVAASPAISPGKARARGERRPQAFATGSPPGPGTALRDAGADVRVSRTVLFPRSMESGLPRALRVPGSPPEHARVWRRAPALGPSASARGLDATSPSRSTVPQRRRRSSGSNSSGSGTAGGDDTRRDGNAIGEDGRVDSAAVDVEPCGDPGAAALCAGRSDITLLAPVHASHSMVPLELGMLPRLPDAATGPEADATV